MKPQQLAKLLNIAPTTLRRWAGEEYSEFLSPSGRGINGAHRSYDDRDARILAWIAVMRARNASPDEIVLTLRSAQGNHWQNLPPLPGGMSNDEPIAVIPREAAEERLSAIQERYEARMQAVAKERDEAIARANELRADLLSTRSENSVLRQKLMEVTDQLLSLNKQLASLLQEERKRRR